MLKNWLQTAALGVLTTGLLACNSIGLGYYFGDRLLLGMVDNYVQLTSLQSEWLQNRLQVHLQWHKQQELPVYLVNLEQWQAMLAEGVTAAEAQQIMHDIDSAYLRLMNRLRPDSVALLAMLDDEQMDHLQAYLSDNSEQWQSEQSKKTDKTRYAEFKERMETWFGPFSKQQDQQLQTLFKTWQAARLDNSSRIKERDERQQTFMAMLRQQPDEQDLDTWLTHWYTYWHMADSTSGFEGSTPNNRRQEAFSKGAQRIQQVDALLTTQQRKLFSQKLQSWINKIRTTLDD